MSPRFDEMEAGGVGAVHLANRGTAVQRSDWYQALAQRVCSMRSFLATRLFRQFVRCPATPRARGVLDPIFQRDQMNRSLLLVSSV